MSASPGASAPPLAAAELVWGYQRPGLGGGLSLRVRPGQSVALIGENGAGKTTLLRTLAGQLPALAGEVRFGGAAIAELPSPMRARRVAYLPQDAVLDPSMTVVELVELGRVPYVDTWGRLRAADDEAVADALRTCDLERYADRPLGKLSGGERQRARLAMILAQGTPLLLLDEPTAHLDLRRRHELFALLAELRRTTGVALVLVLHDVLDAYREADRVFVLTNREAVEIASGEGAGERLANAFGVPRDRIPI